jgi:hypothetical protein
MFFVWQSHPLAKRRRHFALSAPPTRGIDSKIKCGLLRRVSVGVSLARPFNGNYILHSVTGPGSLVHWFESAKGAKCNSLGQRPRTCVHNPVER